MQFRQSRYARFVVLFLMTLIIAASFIGSAIIHAAGGFPQSLARVGQGDLLTLPNGNVTAMNGWNTSTTDAFETFSPTGTLIAQTPFTASLNNTGADTIDANGVVYTMTTDVASVSKINAFSPTGTVLWSIGLKAACGTTYVQLLPWTIIVGPDGNLYINSTQQCGGIVGFITKLNAADGSVAFQKQADNLGGIVGVYSGGLILYLGHQAITYLGFDGSLQRSFPINLGSDYTEATETYGYDGKVVIVFWTYHNPKCPALYSSQSTTRVVEYSPSGQVFVYQPRSCQYYSQATITPQGMTILKGTDIASGLVRVTALSAAGVQAKTETLPGTDANHMAAAVQSDENGSILLNFQYTDTSTGTLQWAFRLLDSGLNKIEEFDTSQLPNTNPPSNRQNLNVGLVPGMLYFALDNCSASSCSPGSPRWLYATKMDVAMDYPRGAILGLKPIPTNIQSVQVLSTSHDPMLTRTIQVTPTNVSGVVSYQYAWAKSALALIPNTIVTCPISANCNLNFGFTNPGSTWNLLVRLIYNGSIGGWWVGGVKIPSILVTGVIGDSVSSGHHMALSLSGNLYLVCDDPVYAYGQTIFDLRNAVLPAKWQKVHEYVNLAHSGFSTSKVLAGGSNACGDTFLSPLVAMKQKLQEAAGSWNVVVGTYGIDDTNWVKILTAIMNNTSAIKTTASCQWYITSYPVNKKEKGWNFSNVSKLISSNTSIIATTLQQADPQVRVVLVGYYNVSGTGGLILKAPQVCQRPIANALAQLNTLQQAAMSGKGVWLSANSVLGSNDGLLQQLQLDISLIIWGKTGWPHPNAQGHSDLGQYVMSIIGD